MMLIKSLTLFGNFFRFRACNLIGNPNFILKVNNIQPAFLAAGFFYCGYVSLII